MKVILLTFDLCSSPKIAVKLLKYQKYFKQSRTAVYRFLSIHFMIITSIPIAILKIVLIFLTSMMYYKLTQTFLGQFVIQYSGKNTETVIAYTDW